MISPKPLRIEIANEQSMKVDETQLIEAVENVIDDSDFHFGSVSIAIVDDPTIHALNVQYLQHDYPTDVLSFPLSRDSANGILEGEIVVSTDTASELAKQFDWPMQHELLLYVIHGTLHLVGFDDKNEESRQEMRAAEAKQLKKFSIQHRWSDSES